jgi:hypothetical protein
VKFGKEIFHKHNYTLYVYEILHLSQQLNQKKTAQPKSETNALATWEEIDTINIKQTPPIQSSTQTYMNL